MTTTGPDRVTGRTYGGDLAGQRYSAAEPNHPEQCRPAWLSPGRINSGDAADGHGDVTASSLQVTPIVVDSTLYFCTPFNRVIALDPEKAPSAGRSTRNSESPVARRLSADLSRRERLGGPTVVSPAPCNHCVFTGTQDAELIALDARTGQPCRASATTAVWRCANRLAMRRSGNTTSLLRPGNSRPGHRGRAGGRQHSRECATGVVRAFDARTGALKWAWDPVTPGIAAAGQSRRRYTGTFRRGTANVWSIMAADVENGPRSSCQLEMRRPITTARCGRDSITGPARVVALRASTGKWRGDSKLCITICGITMWRRSPRCSTSTRMDGPSPHCCKPPKMGHLFLLTAGQAHRCIRSRSGPCRRRGCRRLAFTDPAVPDLPCPLSPAPADAIRTFTASHSGIVASAATCCASSATMACSRRPPCRAPFISPVLREA